MKLAKQVLIPISAVLGVASGCLWFTLGEYLDNHVSNFVAWFLCPALIPLGISLLLFMANTSERTVARAINSLLFFVVYYFMHWAPMGVWIGWLILAGGT